MKNRLAMLSTMFVFASNAYTQTMEPGGGNPGVKISPPSGEPAAPVEPGSAAISPIFTPPPGGGGINPPPVSGPGCTRLPLVGDYPTKGGSTHVRYINRYGSDFQVITTQYDAFVEKSPVYVQTKFVKECIKGEWKIINEVIEQAATTPANREISMIQVDIKVNDYDRSTGRETLAEWIRSKYTYDLVGIEQRNRLETSIRTVKDGFLERSVNGELDLKMTDSMGVAGVLAKMKETIRRDGQSKDDQFQFAFRQRRILSTLTRDYEGEWDLREVLSKNLGGLKMTNIGLGRIKKDEKIWQTETYFNDMLNNKYVSDDPLESFVAYANLRLTSRFMIIADPDKVEAYSAGLCVDCVIPQLPPIE